MRSAGCIEYELIPPRRKHYLRPGKDLTLDWRPLYTGLKAVILPEDTGYVYTSTATRNIRTLMKMCASAQPYFEPGEVTAMFDEFLPYVSGLQRTEGVG